MYVVRRKRVIKLSDREIDLGDHYLTDFVRYNCCATDQIMWEAWRKLSSIYSQNPNIFVSLMNKIGLYNMYVKEIWNVINVKVRYRFDDPVFQVPDFWMFPNETWGQLMGDCEDTTFLLLSAVLRVKYGWESGDDVAKEAVEYGCLGFYIDHQNNAYGHAFMIRKTSKIANGRWLWVETTLENEVPQSVWYLVDFNQLVPVYFFTDKESYRIDKDYAKLGLTKDYVNQHQDLINQMIDYVETGKWLKVKWMHKTRRPVDTRRITAIHIA